MKKITALFATVGLVALLGTVSYAQPAAAPAAMSAAAAMPAPAMRAAPMAPAMRATLRPRPMVMRTVMTVAAMVAAPVAPAPVAPVMAAAAPAAPVMAAAPAVMAPEAMAPTPPTAPAVAKTDSKGSVVGGWILQVILYLLGVFLAAFIPVFTAWLYKKFKLTDLQHKDMIDTMVLKAAMFGIGKAEEASYKLRDNPMDSAKKLDLAIENANKYLRDSGLPEKGAAYLADVIESALGLEREEGNGTTKPAPAPALKPAEKTEEKPAEKPEEVPADDENPKKNK